MLSAIKYEIYYCRTHKKFIHFFAGSRLGQETVCWDCIKEANDRKFKEESERNRARDEFAAQYSHLWSPNVVGGISSVTVSRNGLHVEIESSAEAFREVPDIYLEYRVTKQITGEAA